MRTVKVKICGIANEEDLYTVCSLGADAVGFVVGAPYSSRNLSVERVKRLMEAVPSHVTSVLVMVPKNLEKIVELYMLLKPDVIQIHGDIPELSTLKDRLPNIPIIRAVAVKSPDDVESIIKEVALFDAILVDTFTPNRHGGTGRVHDWNISKQIREVIYPMPLILAGGLNPENVKQAVSLVKPYAVDVSSGVESRPGVKDARKVEAFIREAKAIAFPYGYGNVKLYGG